MLLNGSIRLPILFMASAQHQWNQVRVESGADYGWRRTSNIHDRSEPDESSEDSSGWARSWGEGPSWSRRRIWTCPWHSDAISDEVQTRGWGSLADTHRHNGQRGWFRCHPAFGKLRILFNFHQNITCTTAGICTDFEPLFPSWICYSLGDYWNGGSWVFDSRKQPYNFVSDFLLGVKQTTYVNTGWIRDSQRVSGVLVSEECVMWEGNVEGGGFGGKCAEEGQECVGRGWACEA